MLDAHPAVRRSRVFAREHAHLGEIPVAEIEPADPRAAADPRRAHRALPRAAAGLQDPARVPDRRVASRDGDRQARAPRRRESSTRSRRPPAGVALTAPAPPRSRTPARSMCTAPSASRDTARGSSAGSSTMRNMRAVHVAQHVLAAAPTVAGPRYDSLQVCDADLHHRERLRAERGQAEQHELRPGLLQHEPVRLVDAAARSTRIRSWITQSPSISCVERSCARAVGELRQRRAAIGGGRRRRLARRASSASASAARARAQHAAPPSADPQEQERHRREQRAPA